MKVLFISQSGMHLYVQHLWRCFITHGGMELTVIVPDLYYPDHVGTESSLRLANAERRDGYQLIPVQLRDPHRYYAGFVFSQLAQAIKSADPDIIHVLDEPVSRFLAQAIAVKLLCGLRAAVVSYGFENLPLPAKPLFRLKWRLLWNWMAGVTASNQEALDNLVAAGYGRERAMERIFWGTSREIYRPLDKKKLRREQGIGASFVVGGIGGFLPQKGFHVLLDAVALLPPDVSCILIGSGPERAALERRAGEPDLHGRVRFVSQVPPEKVVEYMNVFDLFVIPSLTTSFWKEQFGKVIAEAMACGVPVIGSDSGAIPEVIGAAGLVTPEGDPRALADAIWALRENPEKRKELSAKGLCRAADELSMEAFAARHFNFYRRLRGAA